MEHCCCEDRLGELLLFSLERGGKKKSKALRVHYFNYFLTLSSKAWLSLVYCGAYVPYVSYFCFLPLSRDISGWCWMREVISVIPIISVLLLGQPHVRLRLDHLGFPLFLLFPLFSSISYVTLCMLHFWYPGKLWLKAVSAFKSFRGYDPIALTVALGKAVSTKPWQFLEDLSLFSKLACPIAFLPSALLKLLFLEIYHHEVKTPEHCSNEALDAAHLALTDQWTLYKFLLGLSCNLETTIMLCLHLNLTRLYCQ